MRTRNRLLTKPLTLRLDRAMLDLSASLSPRERECVALKDKSPAMLDSFTTVAQHAVFGGKVGYYKHAAQTTGWEMRYTVFVQPQAEKGRRPVLWWL